MEFIAEVVFETLLALLLNYPGAAVRWLYYRGRKPFSVLKDDFELNYYAIMWLVAIVIIVVLVVRKL